LTGITGKMQGKRHEAAGRHWYSFGAHHRNVLGALPIAMKQVLEVMEPPTVVFYRFLMASIGLGAILLSKKLPPLRIFRKAALAGVAGYCDGRSVR
jgi:hypothetical protein